MTPPYLASCWLCVLVCLGCSPAADRRARAPEPVAESTEPEPEHGTEPGEPDVDANEETEPEPPPDPNSATSRVSRWRATLPPECEQNVMELVHDTGQFAFGWVYEGSMPDDERECTTQAYVGVVATEHGTTEFYEPCLGVPGEIGNLDGDGHPDMLVVGLSCVAGACPCRVTVIRDTEAGPVLVPLSVPEPHSDAVWFDRDDGRQGIAVGRDTYDRGPFDPPPSGPPTRLIWQGDALVPEG